MNNPKISIIIPAYNSAATIESCIQSIIDQTFTDWELIVADNGSTDGNIGIVKELMGKDSRISLISIPQKGVSNARNGALDIARGEYVCFVDSDDKIDMEYLQALYAKRNSDLVVCGYFVDSIDNLGKIVRSESHTPDSVEWCRPDSACSLVSAFENGYFHFCWNKLFKKSIIEDNGLRFEPYSINEDYIFVLRYLGYVQSIHIVNQPLYHWERRLDLLTGVHSIPDNLLSIYNRSHKLTRDFFGDHVIADNIAFYSYEMIIYKYYWAVSQGLICKAEMYRKLDEICRNPLVRDSFGSHKSPTMVAEFLVSLLRNKQYRIHYILTQKILSRL